MSQLKILDTSQIRFGVMRIFRGFRSNAILRDSKSTTNTKSSSYEIPSHQPYKPSDFEKRILVWSKTFPNKESIPATISMEKMQAAMSRGRIRASNYMMLFVLIGCAYVVISGRQNLKSLSEKAQTNLDDYHRQITAEYKTSLESEASEK